MAKDPASVREVKYLRIMGLGLWLLGFVAIWLGWNGSAEKPCVDCQFPYLVSGMGAGLGFILCGSTLLWLAGLRAERFAQDERLNEIARGLDRLTSAVSLQGADSGSSSSNGSVVAGKSTYHRPDCRLVKTRGDLDMLTPEIAAANGLTPCRVCKPEAVDVKA